MEEFCAGDGVASDGLARLGAIGETSRIAEEDVMRVRDEGEKRSEDSEAAEARVEDADGEGLCVVWFGCGAFGHT
jgi:hypothetical protein